MPKVLDSIGADILVIAKEHQEGRAPKNGAFAPMDFTEGWFRNSGLSNEVSTDVINLAKDHQEGRVDSKSTNVDNFTEGCRDEPG